mgnify:CR=1 FL=1
MSRQIDGEMPALSFLALVATVAFGAVSCTPIGREPIELDEAFADQGVEGRIVVMQVEDSRRLRFDLVGVEGDVHRAAMKLLPTKGYQVSSYRTEVVSDAGAIAGRVARLYIAVEEAAVEESERGRGYRVRVSARLVTTGPSRVLWRDGAVGRSGFSGLLVLLSRPSSRYEAAHEAVAELFDTLPVRAGSRQAGSL